MTILAIAAAALLGLVAGGDSRAQEETPTGGTAPYNDDFMNYGDVYLGFSPPGGGYEALLSTESATLEVGEPVCAAGDGATIWFVYYPAVASRIVVNTAGSDFDTFVGVYRITDFVPSPPGGSLEEVTCDGAAGRQASLEFPARTGVGGYAIQVGGVSGATGELRLLISCGAGCPPPNDNIAEAPLLFEMPLVDNIDTSAATTEQGEPLSCGDLGKTAWYRFSTFENGGDTVSIYATSADFDAVIAIYKVDHGVAPSPPGALSELSCTYLPDEDFPGHTFTTEPFTEYYVQVGGANATGGQLSVLLSCAPPGGSAEEGCFFGSVSVDTGGGDGANPDSTPGTGGGGTVGPPDTGSGGYLPGAR